jgi:hypothetical protein
MCFTYAQWTHDTFRERIGGIHTTQFIRDLYLNEYDFQTYF